MSEERNQPHMRNTVLLTGWLFADLLLALFVIFLAASTLGVKLYKPSPTPTVRVTPTVVSPTPTSIPHLELHAHRFKYPGIDYQGLLNDSPSAINDLKQRLRHESVLHGRRAGLAIAYDGAPNPNDVTIAQNVDAKVYNVLASLGNESFVFIKTSYYDPLVLLYAPYDTITIDVFLFAQ